MSEERIGATSSDLRASLEQVQTIKLSDREQGYLLKILEDFVLAFECQERRHQSQIAARDAVIDDLRYRIECLESKLRKAGK